MIMTSVSTLSIELKHGQMRRRKGLLEVNKAINYGRETKHKSVSLKVMPKYRSDA